jgi:YggT family protein
VTEPVLSRLRRKLPLFAGSIDFSPMVAILVIIFLQRFIVRTLFDLALRMP